ncbi:MAG TPA: hypothetical protein VLD58_11860 [Gemmatimonadales bacterium]|nr:hypothetical protein [Gemmatimonadales bacterium]
MTTPEEVIRRYREGTLSTEEAAAALLPLLMEAGSLDLPLTEEDMPLLDALQRLSAPPLPPAQPLSWESQLWRALPKMADHFWPQIVEQQLDRSPQCFTYVFLVGSEAAAEALRLQIGSSSDHAVTVQLPDDYARASGRLFGQAPPRMVVQDDLSHWSAWLLSLTPVRDAALEKLYLSDPQETPEVP